MEPCVCNILDKNFFHFEKPRSFLSCNFKNKTNDSDLATIFLDSFILTKAKLPFYFLVKQYTSKYIRIFKKLNMLFQLIAILF